MTKYLWSIAVAMILSGCSVHPLPEDITRQSTLAIVAAIRCEAGQAIVANAPSPAFDKGAIGFLFDFDITEHNHAALDLSFSQPFSHGRFDLGLSNGNSDLMREAHRRFTIVDTFSELKQVVKRAKCSQEALQSRFLYPITGSIGLNEVIGTAISIDQLGMFETLDGGPTTVGGQAAVFSDELTYTTEFDSPTVTPTVTLNEIPGVFRLTKASASAYATRKDAHKLTLALALPEPPKSTSKGQVRALARTAAPTQPLLTAYGIPSKVLIHSTSQPQLRVLWELDRRVLLECATRSSGSPLC
jgi:hypothetical protein